MTDIQRDLMGCIEKWMLNLNSEWVSKVDIKAAATDIAGLILQIDEMTLLELRKTMTSGRNPYDYHRDFGGNG